MTKYTGMALTGPVAGKVFENEAPNWRCTSTPRTREHVPVEQIVFDEKRQVVDYKHYVLVMYDHSRGFWIPEEWTHADAPTKILDELVSFYQRGHFEA